jgi:hypothetical protein
MTPNSRSPLRLQLDKAASRAQTDTKLAELLAAVEETISVNEFLLQFDGLEIAMTSLGRNRQSMAHAAESLAGVFDRIIRTNTTIPTAATLEDVLSKAPAGVFSFHWPTLCLSMCWVHH